MVCCCPTFFIASSLIQTSNKSSCIGVELIHLNLLKKLNLSKLTPNPYTPSNTELHLPYLSLKTLTFTGNATPSYFFEQYYNYAIPYNKELVLNLENVERVKIFASMPFRNASNFINEERTLTFPNTSKGNFYTIDRELKAFEVTNFSIEGDSTNSVVKIPYDSRLHSRELFFILYPKDSKCSVMGFSLKLSSTILTQRNINTTVPDGAATIYRAISDTNVPVQGSTADSSFLIPLDVNLDSFKYVPLTSIKYKADIVYTIHAIETYLPKGN